MLFVNKWAFYNTRRTSKQDTTQTSSSQKFEFEQSIARPHCNVVSLQI